MSDIDPDAIRYVVALQCNKTKTRCSGFFCENSFADRAHHYADYPADAAIRFIALDCGGCPGSLSLPKLRHLRKCIEKNTGFSADQVVVHLSSCMAFTNYHGPACPNLDRIRLLVGRAGFKNVVEGTKISKLAAERRKKGIY